jgi:hypothetical protein
LRILGVRRGSRTPVTPTPRSSPSPQSKLGLWHEAQDTLPELESRGSKKRCLPSSAFAALNGFAFGNGIESGRRYLALSSGEGSPEAVVSVRAGLVSAARSSAELSGAMACAVATPPMATKSVKSVRRSNAIAAQLNPASSSGSLSTSATTASRWPRARKLASTRSRAIRSARLANAASADSSE